MAAPRGDHDLEVPMPVRGFDHIALPTAHPEELLTFYGALGFTATDVDEWRAGRFPIFSIAFGDNKINIHPPGFIAGLRGPTAVPGCGDLCFVWDGGVDDVLATLERLGVPVISGPVDRVGGRAGGTGTGVSVYCRDPDDNLVEFICYGEPAVGRIQ
jgi:catechol 2,3-dioxygenase-like lactoylglutathione lyase family enzyme